jgi:hypothetical protein
MFTFCAVTLRKEQQMLEPNQAVEVEVAEHRDRAKAAACSMASAAYAVTSLEWVGGQGI